MDTLYIIIGLLLAIIIFIVGFRFGIHFPSKKAVENVLNESEIWKLKRESYAEGRNNVRSRLNGKWSCEEISVPKGENTGYTILKKDETLSLQVPYSSDFKEGENNVNVYAEIDDKKIILRITAD